jgi:hypothetical protein
MCLALFYRPFKRVPNASNTKPITKAQNPVVAAIGMIPVNDRKPITANITAIQNTTTLGAFSLMVEPPFMFKLISEQLHLDFQMSVLEILRQC